MADTANLVISVDSGNVKNAYVELGNLSAVADKTTKTVGDLGSAFGRSAGQVAGHNAQMMQSASASSHAVTAGQAFLQNLQTRIAVLSQTQQQQDHCYDSVKKLAEMEQAHSVAMGKSSSALLARKAALEETGAATTVADREIKDFMDTLKNEAETAHLTKKQLLELKAAKLGVSKEAAPLIEKITGTEKSLKKLDLSAASTWQEMIKLGKAISEGDWEKSADSLLKLGEKTNALGLLATPAGAAVAVVVAAVGTLAAAAVAGGRETDEFNKQMQLTGGFAGVTKGQFDEMSASIAQSSTVGIGTAKEAMQAFIATGKFSGDTLESVTKTAVDYARTSGKSTEDVVKDFSTMSEGVTKWAEEHNKQYSFLSEAELSQISSLEKHGKASEATQIVMQAFDTRVKTNVSSLNVFDRAIISTKNAFSDLWDAAKGIGREQTIEEKIEKEKKAIDQLQERIRSGGEVRRMGMIVIPPSTKADEAQLHDLQDKLATDLESQRMQRSAARRTSEEAQNREAVREVNEEEEKWHQAHMTLKEKEEKLVEEYIARQNVLREKGSEKLDSEIAKARRLKEIHEDVYGKSTHHAGPAKPANDPNAKELADKLAADKALVDAEKRKNDELQKLDDLNKKYKQISDEQYAAHQQERAKSLEKVQMDALKNDLAAYQDYAGKSKADGDKHAADIKATQEKITIAEQAQQEDEKRSALEKSLAQKQAIADADEKAAKTIEALKKEADQLEGNNAVVEESKAALERLEIAKNQEQINAASRAIIRAQDNDGAKEEIARNEKLIKQLQEMNAQRERKVAVYDAQDIKNAREEFDKLFDSSKGKDFANNLKGSLGEAVNALVKLDKAMETYSANQADRDKKIAAAKKEFEADKDPVAYAANIDRINKESAEKQIASFGEIAAAAKGFFNEGSRGYQALQAVEQVYHTTQTVMAASALAAKLLGIGAEKTATIAAEAEKSAAVTAGVGAQIAANGLAGISTALLGIAKQATIDPITAFPRMAAMAAVMAGLGFSSGFFGSQGGGGMSAADMQKQQGTGTVFGDAKAKSESIIKAMDILKNNSNLMLPVNQGMLAALKNIESSIAGMTNLLVRTPGLVNGTNMGIQTGTLSQGSKIGDLMNSIPSWLSLIGGGVIGWLGTKIGSLLGNLWGKTTQEIVDSGLQFGGKLSDLQAGRGYNQYASVNTTTSSWFGLKKDTSNSVQMQGLSSEMSQQFGLVFSNLEGALKSAAKGLGRTADDVAHVLDNLSISDTKVSLKGLSGQALTDALNAVISKTMDDMASKTFPGLDAFRQVGEGYAQTVLRVSSGIEVARGALEKFGIAAINFTGISNKQGDVATEILRQSITNVETTISAYDKAHQGTAMYVQALNGVGEIMQNMTGTAAELVTEYQSLLDIRKLLRAAGSDDKSLGLDMIKGAGGQSELSSGLQAFTEKYFSDAEKDAAALRELGEQFAKLGIQSVPATREAFRKLVESADLTTSSGQKLFGGLVSLSGAFDSVTQKAEQSANQRTQAYASFLSKQQDLQLQALTLEGKATEVLAFNRNKELNAMDAALRPMQQYIYQLQDQATATAAANATAKQHRDLDIQLMEAVGNAEGALAAKRADTLAGLDDYSKGVQKQIWAAQDAAAAIQKAQQSAQQAQQAEQQAQQKAQQEAQQDQQKAQQEYDQRLSAAKSTLQNAYNAESGALNNLISKMNSFSQAARNMQQSLISSGTSPDSTADQYANAKADLPGVLAAVQGGDQNAIAKLQKFVELSQQSSTDFNDYRHDFAIAQITLDDAASSAEKQVKQATSQLDLLKQQVDGLLNVNNAVLSVADAIAQLNAVTSGGFGALAQAIGAAKSTSVSASAPPNSPGNIGASGNGVAKEPESPLTAEDRGAIRVALMDYMGSKYRIGFDLLKTYATSLSSDAELGELRDLIATKGLTDSSLKMFEQTLTEGMDRMGLYSKSSTANLDLSPILSRYMLDGSHANGLDYVPFDGYRAELHKGERVLTASQTRQADQGNAELIKEVQMLRAEIRAVASNTKDTAKTLDRWTNVGMPATEAA